MTAVKHKKTRSHVSGTENVKNIASSSSWLFTFFELPSGFYYSLSFSSFIEKEKEGITVIYAKKGEVIVSTYSLSYHNSHIHLFNQPFSIWTQYSTFTFTSKLPDADMIRPIHRQETYV